MTEFIVICCYLTLLVSLGLFASRLFRGTRDDYMLASHTIGPFLLLMSLFGTTMTAFALIGSSGESFKSGIGVYGLMASSSGIVHSLCFFLIGAKIYRFGRRYHYTTQIQFFRDRLDSSLIGWLLFPVLVGLIIPYLLIGVIGAGTAIQNLTAGAFPNMFPTDSPATSGGIPPWLGSGGICLVVLAYVFFGGMRGTAWANAFQTCLFMILGLITFIVIANKLGGEDSFFANLQKLGENLPENKATRSDMSQWYFLAYMLIPLSVAMFPHLFQHWLTARNARAFKLPVIMHPIFIMIVWVPCVLIGAWATTGLVPENPPLPTTPDGAVNANAVLPFLVKTMTGPLLGGLLAAGLLAAIMSSLDSQFLCIGTIFTNDIAARMGKFTDRQQVLLARIFICGIVVTTYLISLTGNRSVFGMAIWCFTGYAALFPLIFAALYWRRLTEAGAIASVLTMAAAWIYLFAKSNYGQIRGFTLELAFGDKAWTFTPVLLIFVASTVALVVTSLVTKPPNTQTLARFFDEPQGEASAEKDS